MTEDERQKELEKALGGCLVSGCFIVVLLIAPWLWCEFRGAEYRWQYSVFAVCLGEIVCYFIAQLGERMKERNNGK